jgi:hypothetical protein
VKASTDPLLRVTPRSIAIGLLYVVFLAALTPYNDYYIRNTFLAGNHFPIGSFFLFSVLVIGVNPLMRRVGLRKTLTPTELMVVWIMMLVGSGIPSSGYLRYHLFMLTAPEYFANSSNDWARLFHQYLPDWLVIKDEKAAQTFYEGLDPLAPVPWGLWVRPALIWSGYALLTYFVMLCITVILRKQWVEHERFAFPLVKLPQEMVEEPTPGRAFNAFFRNPMTWAGFAIPVLLHTLNGVHAHIPSVPNIPLYLNINALFSERPWTGLRSMMLSIYPTVIGFSYLLPLDVSLSFWLFYLLFKAQNVITVAMGTSVNGFTMANRQEMGGYIALILYVMWLARRHMANIARAAFTSAKGDDANEALSYRVALLGLIFGTLGLSVLCKLAGMSFWLGLTIHLLFYMMCVVLTWMVTDGGFLFLLAIFRPSDFIVIPLGTSRLSPSDLTIMAYEKTLMFDLREVMMPHMMNSLKAADVARVRHRKLLLPIGLAIVVALAVSYVSGLWVWYRKGGLNLGYWYAPEPFDRLTRQLMSPTGTNWIELLYVGIGMLIMSGLIFMRYQFTWWRLHPLGYAMTTSWAPYTVWFSFFWGWLLKYAIMRGLGFKGYRTWRPFFLGMVVGDALMAGVWVIVGLITKVPYQIMPG